MDKIQQVLYNLLDNAIKFSHHNSVIKLETTEKHNKIFVSVKDTGIGIPKDDLKLIWDRFYKSDLSRGKDKKGTGLGLSITKEIIRSHGENINVISTEGVGTEFIFSLSKSDMEDDDWCMAVCGKISPSLFLPTADDAVLPPSASPGNHSA